MLFHLHFNTPHVDAAAGRFSDLGISLQRRFGSVRGEGVSLVPGKSAPDGFRFKLQVHRRGAVDVTLAPGRRPRFDHLGLVVEDEAAVFERARSRGWSVRESPRRSFVTTPWGFRVEVHDRGSDVVAALGPRADARIESFELDVPSAEADRTFADVFGDVPALSVRRADDLQATVVTLAGDSVAAGPHDVEGLLGE